MAITLTPIIGPNIEKIVEAYGEAYTEESDYMRRGRSDKWPAKRLKHEVGGGETPLDVTASLEAVQAQGFEIDTLPFEPTFIRFVGKIVNKTPSEGIVEWRLFAEDNRYGIMCNYNGDDRYMEPTTMVESHHNPYRFPDEMTNGSILEGQAVAVAAVMIDYVTKDLSNS